jgi:hypothetical protein
MRRISLAIALVLATVATQSATTPSQEADRWALENARPTGEPENCLQLIRIRETKVRDNRTIDFVMNNGDIYRNTLPFECPGLAFDERFAYRTSINRLCNVDTITVLHSDGMRGATCGLGQFQPVEIAERPRP